MLLIKYYDNWADEINIEGAFLITKELWLTYLNLLEDVRWPREVYIGTNESIKYYNKKEYLLNFTIKEVTQEQASVLSIIIPNTNSLSYFKYLGVCALIEIEE